MYKTRYSGFVGTDLDSQLTQMGVDTLVVAGVTTECCVDSTVRDAFDLDYHVFVAADACAAYEPDIHAASLKIMALNSAILTDTAAIAAAWSVKPQRLFRHPEPEFRRLPEGLAGPQNGRGEVRVVGAVGEVLGLDGQARALLEAGSVGALERGR